MRSHVKSLLRKLGVSSRREALEALARPAQPQNHPPWGMRFTTATASGADTAYDTAP